MASEILHRVEGEEGMEAHVARIEGGFSVVLFDTDSGEYMSGGRIFRTADGKTEEDALAYAKTI